MRTRAFATVAALLLLAGPAAAQQDGTGSGAGQAAAKAETSANREFGPANQIDFGVRGTIFGSNSDEARYQRYRDLRDGGTVDRFRLFKDTDAFRYNLQADHIGYDDQRFSAGYNKYGKVKMNFEWNQVPLFYSNSTQTLYDTSNPGVLRMADSVRAGIAANQLSLGSVIAGAPSFELRTRRDWTTFNLVYSPTPSLDLTVVFRNSYKQGSYPWGGSFGIGGAVATELPVPVDHRTTDIGTSLEYSNNRAYAKIAYDGSIFHNNVTTLVWDNPVRLVDSTAGPAQGRESLWPNTDMNTVSASGGIKLPGRSRASGYVSVGNMTNDNSLLPFTVNSALVSPALYRTTSDVKARITAMNYNFTSRPLDTVWFSARYRQYEFDNRTDPFQVVNGVNYDTSIVALNKESEPFSQTKHTFDADATYSPIRHVGFRAGYTREEVDRTYRIIENTTEDIARASVDLTGLPWLSVRGVFEHSKRRGSEPDAMELLSIGEQPLMRHYDIADRDQNRFSTILVVTPVSQFSVNASAAVGTQDYPNSYFGLQNNDSNVYSLGFDYVPNNVVSLGATYGYEKYTALQASRTANPLPANTLVNLNDPTQQWNDPRRNWTDASADHVHTAAVSIDLIKLFPRTDIKFAYDYSRAESTYTYGLAANTVLAAPLPLTPVLNELQRGTLDGRYFVSRHVGIGLVYWYDKYRVNDFALGPVASLAQPANVTPTLMMLGYFYKPYTANSVMARLTYLW